MTPKEFKLLQKRTGLKNEEVGKLVGKATLTVSEYRSGKLHIPGPVADKLRQIETVATKRRRTTAEYVEGQVAPYLKNLMKDSFFPTAHQSDPGVNDGARTNMPIRRYLSGQGGQYSV